eukprot:3094512-Amphidinium_carterae.1
MVEQARKEEIDFIDQIRLWHVVDRPTGAKIIGTRWVDVNKQDDTDPLYRSRLVAKEIKSADT